MPQIKLSKRQAGQLGGLTTVQNHGSEGMAARGRRGGDAVLDKYGRAHFLRMAHARWGRKVKPLT